MNGEEIGTRQTFKRERESYIHRKGNKKYTRHRFMTVVLEIIAAGMLDDIMLVAALSIVGSMLDESVDLSGQEQLTYYWRNLDATGVPFNNFGVLIDIAKADADSSELATEDILETHVNPARKAGGLL